MKSGATCIAYETVTARNGSLPLLKPMSEVAGRMSVQVGAHYLEKEQGGRGVLLGGVPGVAPAKVAILGGGVSGVNAAQMAIGMRADVTIYDINNDRLAELDMFFSSQIKTAYASRAAIANAVKEAELVIGAVLVPGAAAPKLVTRDMLKTMKRGSVLVDIAIDQGGCFETSHATTHADPVYEVDGIIHYCVANMPGAVARTSAFALNNATLPFALKIANLGAEEAMTAGRASRERTERLGRQNPPPGRGRSARPRVRPGLALCGVRRVSERRHPLFHKRAPLGVLRSGLQNILPDDDGALPIARPRHRKAVEEGRSRMARSQFGRPSISEFGRRREAAGMIDERVAEADPQLGIPGIATDGILEDSDRILALAVAGERLGDPKPALGRGEMAEEGVAGVG